MPIRTVLLLTDEPVIAVGLRGLIEGSDNLLLKPRSFDTENLDDCLREARPNVVLISWNENLSLSCRWRRKTQPFWRVKNGQQVGYGMTIAG